MLLTVLAFVKTYKKIFVIVGIAVLLIAVFLFYDSCLRREIKLDQNTINEINTENEARREEALRKTIEDNLSVVRTVDERNALTEVSVEERDRQINAKIKEVDRKIQEARDKQNRDITQDELQCLLVPSDC